MFLSNVTRRVRAFAHDDRGVALPTVLILMIAGVIFTMIIANSVVYAFTFTSTTRSGVQSQASAEAGIAAVRAELLDSSARTTLCNATNNGALTYSSGGITYTAQVYQPSTTDPSGWTAGCPDITKDLRIVSTGRATTPDSGGNPSQNVTTVEAVLSSIDSVSGIVGTGPAIFAYSATGFGGSGTLVSVDSSSPDVMLKTGDVSCTGAASGAANLVVKSGNFSANGSCHITGDVWANGTATLSGGAKIDGSLTASSVSGQGAVGKNVWVDNNFNLTYGSTVGGWVSAGSLTDAGVNVTGNEWSRSGTTTVNGGTITGLITSSGTVTVSNGTASGGAVSSSGITVTGGALNGTSQATSLSLSGGSFNAGQIAGAACFSGGNVTAATKVQSVTSSGSCGLSKLWGGSSYVTTGTVAAPTLTTSPTKPAAMVVPEWVDFGAVASDLNTTGWNGFTLYTMPSGTCAEAQIYAALQSIGTHQGLIDARPCTNGISLTGGSSDYATHPQSGNDGFTVKNDLAIIASKFNLQGSATLTGSGSQHSLWLINPDTTANRTPDCNSQSMSIGGGAQFVNVAMMIYSPCQVNIGSSTNITGQIFAAQVSVAGGATIHYVAVGLPGYDLSTGSPSGVTGTEADRTIESQRNVQAGG